MALLRGTASGRYQQFALDGWPRVADVEAADFNGDGTPDLAVAAFGWRKVGNLSVLENDTVDYSHPLFESRLVDPRPGAIHAIPVDLNGDGRMDLVAVFAQQFEQVVAFINNGTPQVSFTPQVIYMGPHPNWGSSGIQVVDLDGDGDLDVLLTHGDTFDDAIIKPYHGIQWLENKGTFPFTEHTLAKLPGASRAQAVDLDGDADLDIVASAFIANLPDVDETKLPSLVWLEQKRPGEFVNHTIELGTRNTPRSTSATSITTATSTSSWATSKPPGVHRAPGLARRVGEPGGSATTPRSSGWPRPDLHTRVSQWCICPGSSSGPAR